MPVRLQPGWRIELTPVRRVEAGTQWGERFGYSRAVRRAGTIEVSGTTGLVDGKPVGPGAKEQAKRALELIVAGVEAVGGTIRDVARTRMFVVDIAANGEEVGRAHAEVFGEVRPATAMYEVTGLIQPDLLVEIEATALLEDSPPEHPNAQLIRAFHEAQARFYAGGELAPVRPLLADEVSWHVPGTSAIAGDYAGRADVLAYFETRRRLTRATFQIEIRDVIAGPDHAVVLAGGRAQRGDRTYAWETAGVFRLADGKIRECWLLPFDQSAFDAAWA